MKKRKFLIIFLTVLVLPMTYCILINIFGPVMYWTPPPHREKKINLNDLLINSEDLPGKWVIQEEPSFDDHYSNKSYNEDNLIETMENINETEIFTHYVLRYKNIAVAYYKYTNIYKDAKVLFGADSDTHKVIEVSDILKLGDRNDEICTELIGRNGTTCKIFFRIDEYVVEVNLAVLGSVGNAEELAEKVNYYNQLAYSKFVKAGLVEEK
jgi:hypothetical protein